MRYSCVIFDLDGVLVFTDEYHYAAWKSIADRLGIFFNENKNNRLRGVSRMESLEIILEGANRQFSDSEKTILAEEKNELYKSLLGNLSPASITQETIQTLITLRDLGVRLAIGSSSKNAQYILQKTKISHFFGAVASGVDISRSKPDPEVFLLAAMRLKAKPIDCLVVEDAHAGIEAAYNGGFDSAAIGDAYESKTATYRIVNISQVCDIVTSQA